MQAKTDFSKLLSSRQYMTDDIKNQIRFYTVDRENNTTMLIGSLSYKIPAASDVDLLEVVKRNDRNEVIKLFKENLVRLANNIYKDKKEYFFEVKLGIDHLYYIMDFGYCSKDIYKVANDFFILASSYYNKKFFNDEEYNIIQTIRNKSKRNQEDYENIKSIVRNRYVLRWTLEDLNNDFKILKDVNNNDYKYTIENGINELSEINIEGLFINYENYYKEVSNYFDVRYIDDNGNEKSINLSDKNITDEVEYRSQTLLVSAYTFANSTINNNKMKACKRYFSYGKIRNQVSIMEQFFPLINSPFGSLYVLLHKIKTCMKLFKLTTNEKIDKFAFYHTLTKVNVKIEGLIFIHKSLNELHNTLNFMISSDLESISKNYDIIMNVIKEYDDYINEKVEEQMRVKFLYPIPARLLPDVLPF